MENLSLNPRTWTYSPDRARRVAARCRRNAAVAAASAFVFALTGAALTMPAFGLPTLAALTVALLFNHERGRLLAYAAGREQASIPMGTVRSGKWETRQ